MAWDEEAGVFHYPCPCGDRFEISRDQLANCEDIAICPSCSLIIRVIYDPLDFEDDPPSDDDEEAEASADSEDEPTEQREAPTGCSATDNTKIVSSIEETFSSLHIEDKTTPTKDDGTGGPGLDDGTDTFGKVGLRSTETTA